MSAAAQAVSLLVFEAADCLMALPASEVAQLEKRSGARPLPVATEERFDLGEYFGGHESDGPWLRWARGTRCAWLRVRCVVDVVPVALSVLSPMPKLLRGQRLTRAFLAAGVRGDDVFLLLDPARLTS
jgi:hypothetical protein